MVRLCLDTSSPIINQTVWCDCCAPYDQSSQAASGFLIKLSSNDDLERKSKRAKPIYSEGKRDGQTGHLLRYWLVVVTLSAPKMGWKGCVVDRRGPRPPPIDCFCAMDHRIYLKGTSTGFAMRVRAPSAAVVGRSVL